MATIWTIEDIPDQSGKVAIVTGANSGIGYEAALVLAGKGAHIVLACRNTNKAADARARIENAHPDASLSVMPLDLSDLASVRSFVDAFKEAHDQLHLLCNNAGVMAIPFQKTADGFEMQFGTNHLGHFALTVLLLDRLKATPGSRVVNVSSLAHRQGKMNFENLNGEQKYSKWGAYGQSKLSNLLFTYELARKLEGAGSDVVVSAAHPGWAATNLQASTKLATWLNPVFAQSQEKGALPTLRACTDPNANSGDYFGPDGFMEMRGNPKRVGSTGRARNKDDAAKLWAVSESLTGVSMPL